MKKILYIKFSQIYLFLNNFKEYKVPLYFLYKTFYIYMKITSVFLSLKEKIKKYIQIDAK